MTNNENIALTDEELDDIAGGAKEYVCELTKSKWGQECYHCVSDGKWIDIPVAKWDAWVEAKTKKGYTITTK